MMPFNEIRILKQYSSVACLFHFFNFVLEFGICIKEWMDLDFSNWLIVELRSGSIRSSCY